MIEAKKIDSANSIVKATIKNQDLEEKKDKIAKEIAKKAKIQGFRPGKVPLKVVKSMYAADIENDAITEMIKSILDEGVKALHIEEMIAEPEVSKFEKGDEEIEVEIKVYTRPEIDVEGYKECVPDVENIEVSEEEINKELEEIAKQFSETKESDKETAENGGIAVIDFKGFIDGEEMENGSATDYPLELGSNSFIPGFEEQIVGMKVGESKKIKVTFPENYGAKEIAGKEAEFEVTLKKIQEKTPAEINDELAKKYIQKEDATLEELKNQVKDMLLSRKKVDAFAPKKEEILECLVKKFEADLPESVVEKEVEIIINNEASKMSPAEIKELQENPEKLKELREKFLPDAKERVKLTFLIDAIAKKENVDVNDEEISQVIYYEALMQKQNPQDVIKYYQENNLLPVIKMNMIEDKLLNRLLDEKLEGNK